MNSFEAVSVRLCALAPLQNTHTHTHAHSHCLYHSLNLRITHFLEMSVIPESPLTSAE